MNPRWHKEEELPGGTRRKSRWLALREKDARWHTGTEVPGGRRENSVCCVVGVWEWEGFQGKVTWCGDGRMCHVSTFGVGCG